LSKTISRVTFMAASLSRAPRIDRRPASFAVAKPGAMLGICTVRLQEKSGGVQVDASTSGYVNCRDALLIRLLRELACRAAGVLLASPDPDRRSSARHESCRHPPARPL